MRPGQPRVHSQVRVGSGEEEPAVFGPTDRRTHAHSHNCRVPNLLDAVHVPPLPHTVTPVQPVWLWTATNLPWALATVACPPGTESRRDQFSFSSFLLRRPECAFSSLPFLCLPPFPASATLRSCVSPRCPPLELTQCGLRLPALASWLCP